MRGGVLLATAWPGGRQKRGGEFFVESEKEFDALAFAVEGLRAVAMINGAVEVGVGFDEGGRHGERVVKIGECGIGKLYPHIQHSLSFGFHGGALLVCHVLRPREIVIHNPTRILVTTFETPASVPHPSHVHCG